MRRYWRRLKYEINDRVKRHPSLYLPLARRFKRARYDQSDRTVGSDTELLIEAFARTGNSFVRTAFQFAQPTPVRLAHHLHAPAQVLAAAHLGVPAMVMIRQPDDAVLSLIVRHDAFTLGQLFRSYIRFYGAIEPVRSGYVLARFETVTTDLGAAIRRINQRFETRFVEFEHTVENEKAVFELMDQRHDAVFSSDPAYAAYVGRPTEYKQAQKQHWRQRLSDAGLTKLRRSAAALYDRLANAADI